MLAKNIRVAIARIFSDLIMADRIIDAGEMEYWEEVCDKYAIDLEARIKAKDMSFAEAINVVNNEGGKEIAEELLKDCQEMTVSDGFCAFSEALLMIALYSKLDPHQNFDGDVYSLPRREFNIDVATALYIESSFDTATNDAIQENYRTIFKECQLARMHFVYIPTVIAHYQHTDPKLFHEIISFLAPEMPEQPRSLISSELLEMTSASFCKDFLCNRCGMAELRNIDPSLLIKISNSFVGKKEFANYLRVSVNEDILSKVRSLADYIGSMCSGDRIVIDTFEEGNNQFQFHGFYKQLLDIFTQPRDVRSDILINPYKEEITFPALNSVARGLHRRERALYVLLLCEGSKGINFNPPHVASALNIYNRRMVRTQRRYAAIYEMFGGASETVPDLSIPEIRRPIVSCLRRSLKAISGLYNPEDYNVVKDGEGNFTVHIEAELVKVVELDSEEPVSLKNSKLYRRWKEA